MNRPDQPVLRFSMHSRVNQLLHDTTDELHRERFQIFKQLDLIKRVIGSISIEISIPRDTGEVSPSSATTTGDATGAMDDRGHSSEFVSPCEEDRVDDACFITLLRLYKTLSDAASLNAAQIRSIRRQESSLLETLTAFGTNPMLQARTLRIMVTAPRIFNHRASSWFGRNDDPWLRACVAFYGHGKGVAETSHKTTTAASGRNDYDYDDDDDDDDDDDNEKVTFAAAVAQDFPVTLTTLGIAPGLPSYTHAWCPVEKTYLPITELSAAPIIERRKRDRTFVAADVRNAIPMSKRVAAAWAEGRFFLMPLRLGGDSNRNNRGGGGGGCSAWSYQVVLTSMERSRGGEAWMERLDGMVLKLKNGCRPRQELMHLRFVQDLLRLRKALRVQGVEYTEAFLLAEDWKRRMAGWVGREWRLPRDEVWGRCFFEGDSGMAHAFSTVMGGEIVVGGQNWDDEVVEDVEECGFGEVLED
ncbi:hypothetical protein DIS24_g6902 [Lasiodiplodia hormozganensis]|uniref:Uncharacterized protein n=1 Tax=Lasiodiplodia hormozganensis TaxID=869390 RepID=A0AA39YG55_9PEZI|nr:hypothetical protein DIS24_g6902 [Lasiodiplodia hormozganensis]